MVPKYKIIKSHNVDLMIEDNVHYAIELAQNNVPIILLNAPRNKDINTS